MGCSAPAEAGVLHDPRTRTVWLVEIPGDDHLMTAMCTSHADTMVVPRDWEIEDLRDGHPRLWVLADSTVPASRNRSPRRHHRVPTSLQGPRSEATLWPEIGHGDRPEQPAVDPSEARTASEWVGDPAARHSSLLEAGADTPLLARAFRASRAS